MDLFLLRSCKLGRRRRRPRLASRRRRNRRCIRRGRGLSGLHGGSAMVSRIRGLPVRRDYLFQPDAASARQAPRSVVGRDGAVGAKNVRTRPRIARLTRAYLLAHLESQPGTVAARALELWLELGQIAAGISTVVPEAGDKRFADSAWSQHPLYHRMMQTYLAWRTAMHDLVTEDESVEWKQVEQQKFAVTLMSEALAP